MTRSQRPDFAKKQSYKEDWYDLYEDWGLIEASFTSQYGIRLRSENDMSWSEFSTFLAGIMPETPLGQVVSIRCENDKEVLKNFTKEQHKIRTEWRNRATKAILLDKDEAKKQIKMLQEAMKRAFSK
ncbi:bacteriophage Gp15 family protein [Alkaliphilus sp. MSJ-5]|uniref:Bacteriophage Gp15 family protein n=1 Tax=Alkaliphilus flagellatus TaxID=2841507 RepID=A0ABS6G5X9_9FIRM|nr:bacteriophage Gp15 family protein [Alkaliphilus flagellatus]